MDRDMALRLLWKKHKRHDGGVAKNDSVDLTQQLDHMPLAISQAALPAMQMKPSWMNMAKSDGENISNWSIPYFYQSYEALRH